MFDWDLYSLFVGAALGFLVYFGVEFLSGCLDRRARGPAWEVEGYVLDPEHVSAFLDNNPGVLTLGDCHRMAATLGERAAPLMTAVSAKLARVVVGNTGKVFLFRVVRKS